MPRFDFILFHERFEDHQAEADRRIVSESEVDEIWYGNRQFVRNLRRSGSYLMVGATSAGRAVTVVVLSTNDPESWLAYTAWDTKHSDQGAS